MNGELKAEGKYELFKTVQGKEVLNLDDQAYYSLSGEEDNAQIKSTEPDPDKDSSISTGKYYFLASKDEQQGSASIFLQDGADYKVLELPEGLPTKRDEPQKRLIRKNKKISGDEVMKQVNS